MENWRAEALCATSGYDPEIWFADPAEETNRCEAAEARDSMCTARDVCRLCPVRGECLDYALYRPFLQGIWGGLSAGERDTLRKIRARNDKTLVTGLLTEPDLSTYIRRTGTQPAGIMRALQARRTCPQCKEEKDYYISRILKCCRECAALSSAGEAV